MKAFYRCINSLTIDAMVVKRPQTWLQISNPIDALMLFLKGREKLARSPFYLKAVEQVAKMWNLTEEIDTQTLGNRFD